MNTVAPKLAVLAAALVTGLAAAPPTGDQHRVYPLAPTVEGAYRVFVPEDWTPKAHWPLVVILHGGGGTENSPLDSSPEFRTQLFEAARRHHFILVSPRGHKGWWGARMLAEGSGPTPLGVYRWPPAGAITAPPPKLSPLTEEDLALSERDVLESAAQVAAAYGADPKRTFLMGNSMGSIGVLHLVQKDPTRWCAISPSDGPVDPATFPYARVKGLGAALFVHGDNDRVAPIESMRVIAQGFGEAGVSTRFLTIAGGEHSDSWRRALPEVFDFFDQQACGAPNAPARNR